MTWNQVQDLSWAPPVQSDNKRHCFCLDTIKLCKAKNHSQTHRTSFNTSGFRQITFNETKVYNIIVVVSQIEKAFKKQCHQESQLASKMIINFLLAVLQHRISIPKRFLKCPKLERLDFLALLPPFEAPGHRYMWSLIPTFFRMFRVLLKMQTCFSEFQAKKHFEVPQVRGLDVWRMPPGLRARAIDVLGVPRGRLLLSNSSAAATWAVECRVVQRACLPQAASSREPVGPLWASAVRWRKGRCAVDDERKLWAAELHRHKPTNEGTNVLDSTSSKTVSRQKTFTNTLKQVSIQHYRWWKRCVVENVQRTDKASINNVFQVYRDNVSYVAETCTYCVFYVFSLEYRSMFWAVRDNMVCCDIFFMSCVAWCPERNPSYS